jgi:hypothetical protein
MENLIWSDETIYELREPNSIIERIPIDGPVSTIEISIDDQCIPVVVDESYYRFTTTTTTTTTGLGTHISPNHITTRHMKIVVKLHPKSLNSFVFIMNETETQVLDFYITTENGIIEKRGGSDGGDIITKECKTDIISFINHFKLCS